MACKNCKSDSIVNLLTFNEDLDKDVQVTITSPTTGETNALRICMQCDTVVFVGLDDPGNWKDEPTCKKPIKIGTTLWNELLTAGEDVGYAMCDTCEFIVKGFPELYDEPTVQDILCPNCHNGYLEPTGDLIICEEIIEDTGEMADTPLSCDILDILKGLFGDLEYDELYTRHVERITRMLANDDLSIHHPALRLMLDLIHSYDGELN